MKKIYYDSALVTNITVIFSYLSFYTAEHAKIDDKRFSGIISVVTFGLAKFNYLNFNININRFIYINPRKE